MAAILTYLIPTCMTSNSLPIEYRMVVRKLLGNLKEN